jgi:hypothetical protein
MRTEKIPRSWKKMITWCDHRTPLICAGSTPTPSSTADSSSTRGWTVDELRDWMSASVATGLLADRA